jgi:hypothetical protein
MNKTAVSNRFTVATPDGRGWATAQDAIDHATELVAKDGMTRVVSMVVNIISPDPKPVVVEEVVAVGDMEADTQVDVIPVNK